MADISAIIYKLVEEVTNQKVLQKRQIDIKQFLQVCDRYLNAIDIRINQLQHIKNLKERIQLVGHFMHNNQYILREMLVLSHAFEFKWNNFLNRHIPITWISDIGKVYLASEEAILNMYMKGQLSALDKDKERVFRGYIKGKAYNFNPFQLNEQAQKIQQQLNKATQNKKAVFTEGKRRYNRSKQKDMNLPVKPTLYWALDEDGNPKHWFRNVIPSIGFLGQGYIKLALDYPNISMNPVNGPVYFPDQQQYIEMLASYAYQGDNIPGIIQGDIKYDESGNLQFAVKQGKAFHTASITGNIAIAEAFRKNSSNLQGKKINIPELKKHIQNFSKVSYLKLYDYVEEYLQKILKAK